MIDNCGYYDCSLFNTTFQNRKGLALFHLNIGSLSKHFDSLNNLIKDLTVPFKIISLPETKINSDSIPHNFKIQNYVFVNNKTECNAGGTGPYIRESLKFSIREDLSKLVYKSRLLKSTFIELITPKSHNIVVGCIYKHPPLKKSDFIDTYLSTVLDKISKEKKQVILLGDFNINLLSPETDLDSSNFIDTISSFSLKPTINCPTRITDTTETLIDNIIVSETSKFVSGNLTVGISDHLPQFTILDVMKSEPETRTFYRDWKSLDETQFKKDFNDIDWKQTLQL